MKNYAKIAGFLALVAFAAAAWGEANPQPSPVNLVLTAAQLEQINGARGDVAITFTKDQIDKVKKTYANFTATTLTLNKSHVRGDNTVAVVVGARGEANPQPSP